jgi:hypothetical protein
MKSFVDGEQLVSNGCTSSVGPPCFDPASSAVTYVVVACSLEVVLARGMVEEHACCFSQHVPADLSGCCQPHWLLIYILPTVRCHSTTHRYDVTAPAAGTFYLTTNFSTYHFNQDLMVSVNGAKVVVVPVFYTVGWWNQTEPIEVTLLKGNNALTFTRYTGRDVSFKDFFLSVKKPIVPSHPGNYTPVPAPPSPPSSSYIEVPADTTCIKQGIQDVSEEDCGHACLALGFKDTGPRARANMSGCFVMSTGQYAGNCNYNTNKSATCTPPCTLYGSVTRALCSRV